VKLGAVSSYLRGRLATFGGQVTEIELQMVRPDVAGAAVLTRMPRGLSSVARLWASASGLDFAILCAPNVRRMAQRGSAAAALVPNPA
jgi:hypothetical protein